MDKITQSSFGGLKYKEVEPEVYAPYVYVSDDSSASATGGLLVTGTAGALNADAISQDVSAYRWLSIQLSGTWSGTISFQVSNDNTNWVNVALALSTSTASAPQSTSGSNAIFHGPIGFKYFRARMTSYTSGTATATVLLSKEAAALPAVGANASQSGTWNTSVSATPTVTTPSIATSSTQVVAANSARKAITLSNVGANNIWVNFAGGTAVNTNTLLTPNSLMHLDRFVTTGAITAIAATGATSLSVTEWA